LNNNKIEFWELQKTSKLSNSECAEYLEVKIRTITRWRVSKPKAPKAVILAMDLYIGKFIDN